MSDQAAYTPPEIWSWKPGNGGQFAAINRPTAGATHETELPVGRHPLQLYSLATPNGMKAAVMLEELLALGHAGAEYDAWLIRIGDGDQRRSSARCGGITAGNWRSSRPCGVGEPATIEAGYGQSPGRDGQARRTRRRIASPPAIIASPNPATSQAA